MKRDREKRKPAAGRKSAKQRQRGERHTIIRKPTKIPQFEMRADNPDDANLQRIACHCGEEGRRFSALFYSDGGDVITPPAWSLPECQHFDNIRDT